MISYESFFLIILVSILGPLLGIVILIFYNYLEKQVYVLEVENRQIQLQKELEESRYNQLSQQIQPHFLFNALNSMLGLIRLQKYDRLADSFEHMVLYLRTQYRQKSPLHRLSEEWKHTNHYLAIQQLRFGDRLHISMHMEPRLESALVIPYLLQTLVENAFKHGLECIEEDAFLTIDIHQMDQQHITLSVSDNGPGFLSSQLTEIQKKGVGLSNLTSRLHLLFGDLASITIQQDEEHQGGKVIVSWPLVFEMNKTHQKEVIMS